MRDLSGDPGVFIRSMASRGELGGLAVATSGFVQALDAAGFDVIIIETVGAGQAEVDIARLAHTTLVIEAPGLGDDIQAIKAGILEIADILVINKADRPGVESTERALRSMLQLAHSPRSEFHHQQRPGEVEAPRDINPTAWQTPIVRTVATEGAGFEELANAIEAHHKHLLQTGDWQRREQIRLQSELEAGIQQELLSRWRVSQLAVSYPEVLSALLKREISPHEAVLRLAQDQKP
jgi:LAO/AO transport system kinase